MKATYKRRGDGNYEIIVEAQNDDEDAIIENVYLTGSMMALGETQQGHKQVILTTGIEPR